MLRKRVEKNVHGVGTEKKNLHITIPKKKFPASSESPPPPPPSKVKWSAPKILCSIALARRIIIVNKYSIVE